MAVRSKQLAFGTCPDDSTRHVVYTAPVGETVIVKDIHVFGITGGPTRAAVQVGSGGDWISVSDGALAAFAVRSIQCFIVLQPGDQLGVYTEGDPFEFVISGAELEGVAD